MRNINQLSKTASLAKGNQLLLAAPSASQLVGSQYPNKLSIWGLIQYLSTGVFEYLSIEDWFKVPSVPFASLPDPVGLLGARATVTDADRVPDTLMTVGGSGDKVGFADDDVIGHFGSLTNDVFSPYGATILVLVWDETSAPNGTFALALEGDQPNSGWNTIVVNGTTFTRSVATYSYADGVTLWLWTLVPDPFSGIGNTDEVYFGTTGIQFNDPIGGGGSTNVPVFSDNLIWRAG